MSDPPFFPAWRSRFNRRPAGAVPAGLGGLRRCTLDKLEERFAPLLSGLGELSAARASRRERPYSVRRTWWCFLWQMLQCNASCREVVRQLQAMLVLEGRPAVDEKTSAYCQARARLPEPLLLAALRASAQAADARTQRSGALQDRVVKVLDATTLTLPDTPQTQRAYPQTSVSKPGCGFPLMQLLVVWSARGGGVLAHAGVFVLLLGLSALLYWGLVEAGLSHYVSGFLAPLIVGAVVALIGYALIQKAISTFKHETLVPEKTVDSLKENQQWLSHKATA